VKICITSQGKDLESEIDPRFGGCKYFIFYDTETNQYEVVENPWREAPKGAGTQVGQFVASKGAKVLITDKIGPGAEWIIISAGIKIVEAQDKVIDTINKVKKGIE